MTTDQPPGTKTDASASNGKKTGVLAAAFVLVAALAGGAGALIASSGGDDSGSTTTSGGSGTEADTIVSSFAVGENRGFEAVQQGGIEDRENVLVTTDWLADQIDAGLEANNIVLLEVSEELPSSELTRYEDGHIEGAVYVDWSTEFVQANTREFIDQAQFTELAQRVGIDDGDTIVIYGDNNNWFAAYAAWVFKLYGAEDVRLLDGGRKKWEEVDGRELVQEVPTPESGTWEALPQNFDIRSFQPEVLEVVNGDEEASLIDIRFPEEFNGETGVNLDTFPGEGATVWGHIPGAINVPWGQIVNEDGTYKSADEIREIYEEAGVDFDNPIITYCRIGERASHTWFALSQLLGAEVTVYDGSWSEWGNTVGVPVTNNTGDRGGVWSS